MPRINPEKCYILPPLAPSEVAPTSLNIDALAILLARFSSQTSSYIKNRLNEFVGPEGRYPHKAQLIESLHVIIVYLGKEDVDDNQRRLIAYKLLEGLDFCSDGYHGRVNSILLGLTRPHSINELLERIRYSLVDNVARACTDEVHLHNSFFLGAAALGYGVRPINRQDSYVRTLTMREAASINEAFTKKYHALSILNDLQVNIEGELRAYFDYQGRKNIDAPYEVGQISAIVGFINTILRTSLTEEQVFIREENSAADCEVPTDINWSVIQNNLWKTLRDQYYITFSAEEEQLFEAFYASDEIALPILEQPHMVEMFHRLNFIQYPSLFKSVVAKNRIAPLLIRRASTMNLDEFLTYFSSIQSFFSDVELKKTHLKRAAQLWLSIEANKRAIFNDRIDDRPGMLYIYAELSDAELARLGSTSLPKLKQLLLLSAASDAALFSRLIPIIQSLEPARQRELLTAQTTDGRNALMIAAAGQLTFIPPLLELIVTFEPGIQKEIFTAQIAEGANALMLATCDNPRAVPLLLSAIQSLPPAIQKEIVLARTTATGSNVLMLAARYQPNVVAQLVATIAALPPADSSTRRELFLAKTNTEGENALMLAIHHQPRILGGLLSAIQSFDLESQEDILTAADRHGFNVLMKIMQYQPSALPQFLEMIKLLHPATQQELFTAKNVISGSNALMLAARYQPDVLSQLLMAINELSSRVPRIVKEVLKAQTIDGANALMLAIEHQPMVIPQLLEAIQSLALDSQKAIFTAQVSPHGFNALMLAIMYQPDAIPQLLTVIQSFDAETQKAIFTAASQNGFNVLMLAAGRQPTIIPSLLTMIGTFRADVQKTIFTARSNEGYNATMLALCYQPDALAPLLASITQPRVQEEIFTARTANGANLLMLALQFQPITALQFLRVVGSFSLDIQQQILMPKNRKQMNVLMIAATYYPAAIPHLLALIQSFPHTMQKEIANHKNLAGESTFTVLFKEPHLFALSEPCIRRYDLDIQLDILKEPAEFIPAIAIYRQRLITEALDRLSSGSPIEQAIAQQLQAMQFNADAKREAIIIALYQIKRDHRGDADPAIIAALANSESPLYHAFNKRRYACAGLFGGARDQTGSLRKIIETARSFSLPAETDHASEESPLISFMRLTY